MPRIRRALLLGLLAVPTLAQDGFDDLRRRVRLAKNRVFPSLVHIVNVEEAFALGRRRKAVSTGSGFFIDAKGHIVTNYHVAGQAQQLLVTLSNGRKVRAELVAGDPYTDLALIRVDPKKVWPEGKPFFAFFGDSNRLQEGDFVMAMGSPLSLSRSMSFGIISSRNRLLGTMRVAGHETGKYNTWLQTDAAINPGNSGGPLVNLRGEVVGVNTRANTAANNIGFAIPSNVVKDVVSALLRERKVPRSYLGVKLQPVQDLADTRLNLKEGALVAAVDPNSPAAKAGIRPGDTIVALNGRPFAAAYPEEVPGLYERIAKLPVDGAAAVRVRRGSRTAELTVRPVPLGRHLGRETDVTAWGVTVRGITARMARDAGLADTRGVLVTGVRAGAPAAGVLDPGDIVRTVQGREIEDLAGFVAAAAAEKRAGTPRIRLTLRRGTVLDVATLEPEYGDEGN